MTELRHLGALAGIELAATGADEDLQRLVALSHRDRMALAIVIGNVRRARGDLLIGVARAQKHRAAADEGRARRQSARRAKSANSPATALRTICIVVSLALQLQSRMKPYLPR